MDLAESFNKEIIQVIDLFSPILTTPEDLAALEQLRRRVILILKYSQPDVLISQSTHPLIALADVIIDRDQYTAFVASALKSPDPIAIARVYGVSVTGEQFILDYIVRMSRIYPTLSPAIQDQLYVAIRRILSLAIAYEIETRK